MRRSQFIFVFITLISVSGLVTQVVASTENHPWELVKKAEGIEVYQANIPGSDLVAFKGEGLLDYGIGRLASILLDTARASEWILNLVESHIVKRVQPLVFIEYSHIGTPFIIKDRDFLSQVEVLIDEKQRTFGLKYNTAESAHGGVVPKTGFIRGELHNTTFMLHALEKGKTKVTAMMHADPKGTVPKWIVNFFQKSWPLDTFESLKKQAAKSDIRRAPEFIDVIEKVEQFEKN
ncbi:MAG: START domain-containing protein [Bdellovibrionota bacterium]